MRIPKQAVIRSKTVRVLSCRVILLVFLLASSSFMASFVSIEKNLIPQAAPLNEEFVNYQKDPVRFKILSYSEEGYPLGLLPSPHDISHVLEQPPVKFESLPGYFDIRNQNKLTFVKNQGNCGSCWAFATYGSLESYLMPSENWNFSEQNLIDRHGFDYGPCDGGQIYMSTAYLARWDGPVKEEDDPYIYESLTGFPVRKHVQDVIFIPPRSDYLGNDLLKQAVMTYGAVYSTMYYKSSCYNSTHRSYYNPNFQEGSHAVAIVGWDDNFDRNKFLPAAPGNGAFIVRNSWGASWGESGYFYVSYYDEYFGRKGYNAVVKGETLTNYEIIYQYDLLGWVSSLGYGADTAWFANIFTCEADIPLTAVSFYTDSVSNNYEMRIYRDVADGQPRSGVLSATKNGEMNSPGFFTIPLDSAVALKPNQKFSVVIKLKTSGYNYPIPFERPIKNYSSKAAAGAGESFISSNGDSWSDLHTSWDGKYANSNVCLKALSGFLPLFPPANFAIQRLENNLVFSKEYINRITWDSNPKNKMPITKCRLYRKDKSASDKSYKMIGEFSPSAFSFDDRGLKKSDLYSYWITAMDEYGRESEPAVVSN